MATGLSNFMGSILGVGPGTGSNNAAGQLNGQGIAGPAMPNLAGFNADQAQQQQILALLQGQAAGTGPSAAQAQLSQGVNQSMAAQQAAAAGGRYGQNAALRQQGAAGAAAQLEGSGANQAAQLRAQQMAAGAQAAGGLASTMGQQQLGAAQLGQQGQLAYNAQLAGLYGQQMGAEQQLGSNLASSVEQLPGQAMTGSTQLASMSAHGAAHGGAFGGKSGGLDLIGEEGPEAVLGVNSGKKKLVSKPQLTRLGVKEPQVVVPLKDGSAPYKGGAMPSKVTKEPSKPLPKGAKAAPEKLSPEAEQAIMRLLTEIKGQPHAMAGGGVEGLDTRFSGASNAAADKTPKQAVSPILGARTYRAGNSENPTENPDDVPINSLFAPKRPHWQIETSSYPTPPSQPRWETETYSYPTHPIIGNAAGLPASAFPRANGRQAVAYNPPLDPVPARPPIVLPTQTIRGSPPMASSGAPPPKAMAGGGVAGGLSKADILKMLLDHVSG